MGRDFGTIAGLVRAHAAETPDATALIDGDRRLNYAELDVLMDRVAAGLQRDGLVSGDIIAVCGRNSLAYAALFLGALRAGVAVSPLAPSSTPEAIAAMVRDCDAKLFFLDAATGQDLARLQTPIPLPAI
ncbi:MAG: 4-coumarate--CoA ligase, partial [Hyphomicrobiales bacterium]